MEQETATRAKSHHSEDATPHPRLWGDGIPKRGEPWVINTCLATESSDEEPPLDPKLDRSGVPFPEDQAEEDQVQMSRVSSGKDSHLTDVSQEVETEADHIQVAHETTMALAVAEIDMATLKRKHDRELADHLVKLQNKDL